MSRSNYKPPLPTFIHLIELKMLCEIYKLRYISITKNEIKGNAEELKALKWLEENELVIPDTLYYLISPKGKTYINYITSIPLPEPSKEWVIPFYN